MCNCPEIWKLWSSEKNMMLGLLAVAGMGSGIHLISPRVGRYQKGHSKRIGQEQSGLKQVGVENTKMGSSLFTSNGFHGG